MPLFEPFSQRQEMHSAAHCVTLCSCATEVEKARWDTSDITQSRRRRNLVEHVDKHTSKGFL